MRNATTLMRLGSNPLPPDLMAPTERRAELCRLLALGLVRLHLQQSTELSAPPGESSLPSLADPSGHANPSWKETA